MSVYMSSISEEELIERCQNRDDVAFSILYGRYKRVIFSSIKRIVSDEELVCDIHQETFLKVWNSISTYDASRSKLFTWMLSIARNLVIDRVRSKEYKQSKITCRLSEFEDPESITGSYQPVQFNSDWIDLHNILTKLEPRYVVLLDLIYFKGYTHTEVAEELNIPLGTVKTQLRMAVSVLRQYFA